MKYRECFNTCRCETTGLFLTNISTCVCIVYGSQSTGIENIFNNTQPHDDVLLGAH